MMECLVSNWLLHWFDFSSTHLKIFSTNMTKVLRALVASQNLLQYDMGLCFCC